MLAAKLLGPSSRLLAAAGCGAGRVVAAAPAAARRGLAAAGSSSAGEVARGAAAGTAARQPGEEGGMKTSPSQSALPDIGGYGEDPVAVVASASEAAEGAKEEVPTATEGALGAAADAASGAASSAAEAVRGAVGEAASAAKGAVGAAAESGAAALPGLQGTVPATEFGNVKERGEAPATSGHAKEGWTRWKKEADDSLLGGTPEPGIVLE